MQLSNRAVSIFVLDFANSHSSVLSMAMVVNMSISSLSRIIFIIDFKDGGAGVKFIRCIELPFRANIQIHIHIHTNTNTYTYKYI